MIATTTVTASIAPITSRSFFWPFWGFGSSTGDMRQVSHLSVGVRTPGPPFGRTTGLQERAQGLAASSSTVRLRPARTPTTICGTISAAMSAMGTPQPPLLW